MKLKVAVAKLNESGCVALLENDDDEQIAVAVHCDTDSPRTACREAAHRLRACAERFDLLADQANPYQEATQKKVNHAK